MIEIMMNLQGGAKAPLYEKIYEYIKSEITDGRIPRGERLPSTRLLAKNLAVSRSTVEMAYDQLLAEGYIQAEPCRGFFVCDIAELYRLFYVGQAFEQFLDGRIQTGSMHEMTVSFCRCRKSIGYGDFGLGSQFAQ